MLQRYEILGYVVWKVEKGRNWKGQVQHVMAQKGSWFMCQVETPDTTKGATHNLSATGMLNKVNKVSFKFYHRYGLWFCIRLRVFHFQLVFHQFVAKKFLY